MKTPEQVKADLRRNGVTVTAWARAHGVTRLSVHRVMSGKAKCYRGDSHRIAVLLGLKDGEIVEM